MTGDFCLIDYIFYLFLVKGFNKNICFLYALRTLGKRKELHGIIFDILILFVKNIEVYNLWNGQVQAFFYIMSTFVIRKK